MSGLCYSCASRFGTFNKELGCKNCGFAFCKKCLTKKTAVPKLANKNVAVCDKCYNILTGKTTKSDASAKYDPPDALLKRLAALEQNKTNVATRASSSNNPATVKQPPKHKGLATEDRALVERLERLKESHVTVSVPTESDIEARLAKLKQVETPASVSSQAELSDRLAIFRGQEPGTSNQSYVPTVERRSEQQQIDSLLEEISDEVMIDVRLAAGSVNEIQDRLNKLKSGSDAAEQNNFDVSASQAGTVPLHRTLNPLNIPAMPESSSKPEEPSLSEIDRVIREAAAEAQIEADRAIEGMKKDKELWNRVQQLKDSRQAKRQDGDENVDSDKSDDSASMSSNDGCSEAAASRLAQQILEENALDERCGKGVGDGTRSRSQVTGTTTKHIRSNTGESDDDLPWCCICNNDATLRCAGCDGDLYCQRCYREGHDRFEMKDHRTTWYSSTARHMK